MRFIEIVGEGSARAYYPADSSNEIVAPVMEGKYFADAICPALLGSDGRIAVIYPPLAWPEGGDPLLVGDAEVDRARVEQLQEEANQRFEDTKAAFDEFVPSVNQGILDAQASASQAATDAANLQALVDSGLMRVEKASNPPTPGKGLSWLVVDELTGTKGVGLRVANSAGTAWMSYPILAEDVLVVGSDGTIRLKNGVVTAEALAATIALVTRLIAGPEDGFHTELDQTGVHFHSLVDGVTGPVEMLQINTPGTDGDAGNVFALRDPLDLDSQSMSINEAGQGSYADLAVANLTQLQDVTVRGETLDEILDRLPRGEIARGSVKAPAGKVLNSSSGAKGFDLAKLKFVAEPGRSYHIIANGPLLSISGNEVGAMVTINGAETDRTRYLANGWSKADADCLWSPTGSVPVEVEIGFRIQMYLSTATVHGDHNNIDISVQDIGPLLGNSAEVIPLVGDTAPTPVVKQTYTKTLDATWLATYPANSYYAGKATQGTYNGTTYTGVIGFPDLTGELAGSVVNEIQVYLYFSHWYWNSGGEALIALSPHLNQPGSASGLTAWHTKLSTGKPGDGWVALDPSVYAQFKSGAYRGIALIGSGQAAYGTCTAAKIWVKYTK